MRKGMLIAIFIWPILLFAQSFNHPGALHNQEDLDRMKEKVAEKAEPWYGTWQKLINGPHANLSWTPHPQESICRGCPAGTSDNYMGMAKDIACAYGCALRWHVSGDIAYANKAVAVMNAWGSTLKELYGDTNSGLARGAYGYEWACVGDLMYNYEGWDPADKLVFKKMLLEVFLPGNQGFLAGHNNTQDSHYRCNWDGFNMSAVMAIGIFADSTELFDSMVDYYKNGVGNGNINHAVVYVHEGGLGQWEESGRDQPHATHGAALIGYVCQMAWNQGVDLFGYDDNRLLKGIEYLAKYNLNNYVPYKSHTFWWDQKIEWPVYTNTEHVLSTAGRGVTGPLWELAYNHYVNIKGLDAPYLGRKAASARPVGGGGYFGPNSGGYDHLGFGSLTYALSGGATPQTITFNEVPALEKGVFYQPKATSTSGKNVYFSSSNTDVVDIIKNKFYARKPGTATIKAWCNGDSVYDDATEVSRPITVTEANILAFSGKYNISTDGWFMMEGPQSSGTSVSLNYNRYSYNAVRRNQFWNINPIPQHWYIRRVNGNDFNIINVAYNLALSVVNGNVEENSLVQLRPNKGDMDQVWTIASDGTYFSFTNKASGKVLSIVNDNNADGARFEIRTDKGSDLQRFLIQEQTSGKPIPYLNTNGTVNPDSKQSWRDQTITFNEIEVKSVGDADFKPNAISSSGLKLKFSSSDTTVAKIIGDTIITIKSEGISYISAFQDGDYVTNGALPVSRLIEVSENKTDMIAYYRFERNALDASGNNKHGTQVNNASYGNGKKGYAVNLNGTDEYVSLPSGILQDVNDMTISTWIKLKSTSGVERIFDFEKDETAGLYLEYDFDNDSLSFNIENGGLGQSVSVKQTLASNNWTHITLTLSTDTCTLYVDGIEVANSMAITINPSDIGTTVANRLGCSHNGASCLNGAIDDLRIYNKALDAEQIDELVNGYIPEITNALEVSDTARQAFNFQITATNSPTKFEAIGIPSGLKINSATGTIVGKPMETGTYNVTLRASNYFGTASQILIITIVAADNGGLIVHYPFNNSADDISGFDYHGTLVNGPSYATGKVDKSLKLDGSNDHVTLPTGLLVGIEDLTICTWVKLDVISTWSRIFDFGTGTNVNMFLTPKSGDGTLRFAIKNGGNEQRVDVAQPLTAGAWIHVAVTLSGSTGKIYVNGVLKGSSQSININPTDLGATNQNYIGRSQWPDPYLDGSIDDFRMYDRALTKKEINEIITTVTSIYKNSKELEVSLFPNPVNESFIIEVNKAIASHFEVINAQGMRVLSGKINQDRTTVNLSGFPSGLFFVRIVGENSASITRKLMKK